MSGRPSRGRCRPPAPEVLSERGKRESPIGWESASGVWLLAGGIGHLAMALHRSGVSVVGRSLGGSARLPARRMLPVMGELHGRGGWIAASARRTSAASGAPAWSGALARPGPAHESALPMGVPALFRKRTASADAGTSERVWFNARRQQDRHSSSSTWRPACGHERRSASFGSGRRQVDVQVDLQERLRRCGCLSGGISSREPPSRPAFVPGDSGVAVALRTLQAQAVEQRGIFKSRAGVRRLRPLPPSGHGRSRPRGGRWRAAGRCWPRPSLRRCAGRSTPAGLG